MENINVKQLLVNKYRKPHIDEDRLGKNPFLINLQVVVSKMELEGQWSRDKDGDILPAVMEAEKVPYTKFFSDKERRLAMVKLSLRAKDLLLWIMSEVETGKDWIWINKKRYMEESGVSTYNTYNAAVNDLIRENYIGRVASPANVFWINPHFFFNGNRVKCFPKNVVKR